MAKPTDRMDVLRCPYCNHSVGRLYQPCPNCGRNDASVPLVGLSCQTALGNPGLSAEQYDVQTGSAEYSFKWPLSVGERNERSVGVALAECLGGMLKKKTSNTASKTVGYTFPP